eukprot:7666980-Heterocapsa_arctica.AAC.1
MARARRRGCGSATNSMPEPSGWQLRVRSCETGAQRRSAPVGVGASKLCGCGADAKCHLAAAMHRCRFS